MALLSQQALEQVMSAPLPDLMQIRMADATMPKRASAALEALLADPKTGCLEWQMEIAEIYLRLGNATGALEHARMAMRISAEQRGMEALPRAWYLQAQALLSLGIYGGARQLLEQLESLATGLGDEWAMGLVHDAYGWLMLRSGSTATGEFVESLNRFEKALEIWTRLDSDREQIRAMEGISSALLHLGRHIEALETIDSSLHLAAYAGDWALTHRLLQTRAGALREQGYRQLAEDTYQLALDWCAYEGDEETRARALMGLGSLYAGASDLRYYRTEPTLRSAISIAEKLKTPVLTMEARMLLADYLAQDGQQDRAQEERGKALQMAEKVATEGTRKFLEIREAERKIRDENRRQRFERRMREAFEGSMDAVFIFDVRQGSDGSVIDLINEVRNSSASKLIGTTPHATRLLSELESLPIFAGLIEPFQHVLEAHIPYEDEMQVLVDDAQRWFARRIFPMSDGAALTIRDVTERRTAEADLLSAAEKARSADQAKTEFLAHMSHEVRTPITSVLSLARLLAETSLNPTQFTYVEGIVSSAEILLGIIGDLLDLSKIETGHLRIETATVNIRKLIEDAVQLLAGQAREKGIQLKTEVDDSLAPFLTIDGSRLRQVILNLLGNALKFTDKGSVTVRAYPKEKRFILEVEDTGIGIEASQKDRIFVAFEQVEGTHRQGTGLGLAISRKLIGLMGGEIGVESEPGEGSRFSVSLPLEEALGTSDEPDGRKRRKGTKQFSGRRVLVADDNRFIALVAKTELAKLGCEVEIASDGPEAVEKAKAGYDAILMDVYLATMKGTEATRQIREYESNVGRYTPIIAITAALVAAEREECLQAGMDEYLGKPFTIENLKMALETWLR